MCENRKKVISGGPKIVKLPKIAFNMCPVSFSVPLNISMTSETTGERIISVIILTVLRVTSIKNESTGNVCYFFGDSGLRRGKCLSDFKPKALLVVNK